MSCRASTCCRAAQSEEVRWPGSATYWASIMPRATRSSCSARRWREQSRGRGRLIFIPYMAGERTPIWSSTARGVFFGLSYSTTRGDMLRAIMEGCAFAVYDNLKVAEQMGATVVEWLGSGGATRSAEWCQIKADVTGKPFVVARRADGREGGHTLGLFAMTAHAIGLESDIGACVERLLPQRQVFYPRPEQHALYEELFGVYMSVSRKLMPDFDRLAAITRGQTAADTKLHSMKGTAH